MQEHQQRRPLGLFLDRLFRSPGLPPWAEAACRATRLSPVARGYVAASPRSPSPLLPLPSLGPGPCSRHLDPCTGLPVPSLLESAAPSQSRWLTLLPKKPPKPPGPAHALLAGTERLSSHRPTSGVGLCAAPQSCLSNFVSHRFHLFFFLIFNFYFYF